MQAPTDNLYKFLAIFGLVLIVTSSILMFQSYRDHASFQLEYEMAFLEHEQAIDEHSQKSSELLSIVNAIDSFAEAREGVKSGSESEEDLRILRDHNESMAAYVKHIREWEGFETPEFKKKQTLYMQYLNEFLLIRLAGVLGLILGFSISILGFWFWYFKLQVHLDRQITNENISNKANSDGPN